MRKILSITKKAAGFAILLLYIVGCTPGEPAKSLATQTIFPAIPTETRELIDTCTPESTLTRIPTATRMIETPTATLTLSPPPAAPGPTATALPTPRGLVAFVNQSVHLNGIDVIKPEGSGWKQLTTNQDNDYESPSWSPDGQWIAYSMTPNNPGSNSVDPYQIFIVRPDGSGLKQLTFGDVFRRYPTWSPDGQTILFTEDRGNGYGLYSMAIDGGHYHPVLTSKKTLFTYPSWSPDGKSIAYVGIDWDTWSANLFIMDADGKNQRQVKPVWFDNSRGRVPIGRPAWSPDSQEFFITTSDCQVDSVDLEGNLRRISTSSGQLAAYPTMSPDGLYLAFSQSDQNSGCLVGVMVDWGIGLMTSDNQFVKTIIYNADWSLKDLAWSPVPGLRTGSTYTLTDLGDRLTLRNSPTLKGAVVTNLNKGDSVVVEDGPVYADYYYWWKERTAEGVEGWAVDYQGGYRRQ